MPPTYTPISKSEMKSFLESQGYTLIYPPIAAEDVYGKIIAKDPSPVCIRVFTSIVGATSRLCGNDAIRVSVVTKSKSGRIQGLGSTKRVNRTQNWKSNLQERLALMESKYTKGDNHE